MLISATHLNSGVLQQRVLAADPAANPAEVTALLRWGKAEPGKHAGCGVSDECLELQPPWGFLAHKAPTSASPEPLHSRAPLGTHTPTLPPSGSAAPVSVAEPSTPLLPPGPSAA